MNLENKSMHNIKKKSDYINIILLLILLFYALVPFETGGSPLALKIHIALWGLISFIALYINNFTFKINLLSLALILFISFYIAMVTLQSSGPYGLIMTFSFVFAVIVAYVIRNNIIFYKYFLNALKLLIIISILILFLQLSIFTLTGNIIHFHQLLFPFSSEARIGMDKHFAGLYRLGGAYTEPGTYSSWLYTFMVIYMVLKRKIDVPLISIGAISIFFSYSVWGMLFGSYLLFILFLIKIKTSSLRIKILVILSFLSIGFIYINYLSQSSAIKFATYKLTKGNASTKSKEKFYQKFYQNADKLLIIGEGYTPHYYEQLDSPQDAGIYLNILVVFGIIFGLLILMIYTFSFFQCCSTTLYLISMPVLLSKLYYWDPSFWLLFFLVLFGGYSNNQTNQGEKY